MALVVAVGCAVMAWHRSTLDNDWVETTGTVIDVHVSRSSDSTDYDTTIRFEDWDHIEYEFRSEYGSRSTRYDDQVTVRYDPRNPSGARVQISLIWEMSPLASLTPAILGISANRISVSGSIFTPVLPGTL